MLAETTLIKCSICAEEIESESQKCKYCGELVIREGYQLITNDSSVCGESEVSEELSCIQDQRERKMGPFKSICYLSIITFSYLTLVFYLFVDRDNRKRVLGSRDDNLFSPKSQRESSFNPRYSDSIRAGFLHYNPKVTIEQVFDSYRDFSDIKWSDLVTNDGKIIVQVNAEFVDKVKNFIKQAPQNRGYGNFRDINLCIQFTINEDRSFNIVYIGYEIFDGVIIKDEPIDISRGIKKIYGNQPWI